MTLFERPVDERELRLALEDTYRERARLVSDISTRVALVDRANAIRPKTLL
jgi:serine/threonine-protein kinase PknG